MEQTGYLKSPKEFNPNLKYYKINEVPNLKINGRTIEDASPLPLFWNNSGIELLTDSSEVWVDLAVDHGFHEPWIATELNGAFMSRRMLNAGEYPVCLFRSMIAGNDTHISFYRELQAMGEDDLCHVLVKGIYADGSFKKIKPKKLKLEFIGDSITSGEGTYGTVSDTEWLAMYMSSSKHYANLIGKELDADIRIISQGGWGIYCGWDNDTRHNIPSIFDEVCGLATGEINRSLGAGKPYEPGKWQPDVVVVNLGTNDASAFEQPPFTIPETGEVCKQRKNPDGSYNAEDAEKVRQSVIAFLKKLRGYYKNSHIVWVYGMLGYGLSMVLGSAVSEYTKETGDDNVAYINLPDTNDDEYGAHYHPGFASHEKAAEVLITYIRRRL